MCRAWSRRWPAMRYRRGGAGAPFPSTAGLETQHQWGGGRAPWSWAGYAISAGEDGVAFHFYGGFETTTTLGGVQVALHETSDYPWAGEVRIEIDPEAPAAFDLKLRIPGWAEDASASINGELTAPKPPNG